MLSEVKCEADADVVEECEPFNALAFMAIRLLILFYSYGK